MGKKKEKFVHMRPDIIKMMKTEQKRMHEEEEKKIKSIISSLSFVFSCFFAICRDALLLFIVFVLRKERLTLHR